MQGKASEKDLERRFVDVVNRYGGIAYKMQNVYQSGFPDRVVFMPGGGVCFVEFKSGGEKLRRIQAYVRERLTSMGYRYYVVDSREQLSEVLKEIGVIGNIGD